MFWFLRVRGLIAAFVLATVSFALWQMSVPNLIICRLNANESGAIATLGNLRTQQQQFLARRSIDRDGDGCGEAGFFEELSGAMPLRTANGKGSARLQPALLSPAFAAVESGCVHRNGYWFQLYLPTADGHWVGSCEQAREVGIDASETAFCIYAWPDGTSGGMRVFFTDAAGDTWSTRNEDRRYCGRKRPVPVDAALPTSAVVESAVGARIGRDGRPWFVVD